MMEIFPKLDILTLFVFSVLIVLCYLYLFQNRNLPPGPLRLPLVGNVIWLIQLVISKEQPYVKIHRDSKKYGGLIYMAFFRHGFLFVNGFDAIHEVFVKNAEYFSDRPYWITAELEQLLKDGRGKSLFTWAASFQTSYDNFDRLVMQSGEDWKTMRKFASRGLKVFGVGTSGIEEKILFEIRDVTEIFNKTSGKPFDTRRHISRMISNIIHGICFGQRFDIDDKRLDELLQRIFELFEKGNPMDISSRLPNYILRLIGRDKVEEAKKLVQNMNFLKEHITHVIRGREESFDGNNIRDFIDLYIQDKRADEDKHVCTVGNLFQMILDLFLAGNGTTQSTIMWAILYMIEYPDVQKRCQEEMHEKYGDQEIHWSHRTTLPYVEATLMEILRLANIAPFSLRTNEKEATVRGYTIPKRTLIFSNLYSSHLDDRYWTKPEQFDPGRFLQNGQLKKEAAFIPFSLGPRMCAGEHLARMEIFLIFCNLLQRFTFKRECEEIHNNFDSPRFQIATTPFPFKTKIIARDDATNAMI